MAQRRNSLDPGRLDQTVTIQSASIPAASGASDPDWDDPTTVQTCRAEVTYRQSGSSEGFDAKSIDSTVSWRVRIGYRSGITTKMRVLWGDEILDIAVIDSSLRMQGYLDLYCTQRQA